MYVKLVVNECNFVTHNRVVLFLHVGSCSGIAVVAILSMRAPFVTNAALTLGAAMSNQLSSWEDVANARSRAPYDPPLPAPMSQRYYQSMVQRGLNPCDFYNPNSGEYSQIPNAGASPDSARRCFRLPATLVQVDDGSMAAASSSSSARNFSGRGGVGRFSDQNMFSADARTMQRDMVALVAGWLSENGYLSTALTLADEAGGVMTNDYHHRKMLRTVARHVETGSWDLAQKAVDRYRNQNSVTRLGDGHTPESDPADGDGCIGRVRANHVTCVDKGIAFMMARQQYLEMLESGGAQQASGYFHKRLARFEGYIGEEHYQTLASLLACRSISGDGARMYPHLFRDWSVLRGRQQIIAELTRQADESLNPCAYVSSLSPRPEAGELSQMVSEALSYRIVRNNPALVSKVLSGEVSGPTTGFFLIPSLLKASSLAGDVVMQLPPQRLLCCFDFNSPRPSPNTPLHSFCQSLPYEIYYREGSQPEDSVSRQVFVQMNAPSHQHAVPQGGTAFLRLTACAPLLSRSSVVVGTRSGELLLVRVPTAAVASNESGGGSCELLARLPHRVWALDTAVLGPAQSGDFCRRDMHQMFEGEGLRPANGGLAEVLVGAVSGDTATVISLATRKVVRMFVNGGNAPRGGRLSMTHSHRQRGGNAACPLPPSADPSRIDHDAQKDLLSIALFSPNPPSTPQCSASAAVTGAERGEFPRRRGTEEGRTENSPQHVGLADADGTSVYERCSGQQLLCAVGSEGGELIVFDVFNDSYLHRVRAGGSPVVSIAFSTTGNSIYAGYKDGAVRVIDTVCGVVVRQFDPSLSVATHSGLSAPHLQTEVCATAASSNGSLLAVAYSSSTIHIIDLASGQPLPIYLAGHSTSPRQLSRMCFGATSRIVVSTSDDGFLCVWDLSSVLSTIDSSAGRDGMTALMPTVRIPLRMGSALGAPYFPEGSSGASSLSAREHSRLLDATSDVKYDRVHDMVIVTTEDGRMFFVGP